MILVRRERIVVCVQDFSGESMKKLTKAILERDAKRDIGAEILQAVREIKAGKTGRVFNVEVTEATEAASSSACRSRSSPK